VQAEKPPFAFRFPQLERLELERSLERLERLVLLAAAIRREYPDTKRRDTIAGAVLLVRIDDDCEAHGLAPAFTLENVERARDGGRR